MHFDYFFFTDFNVNNLTLFDGYRSNIIRLFIKQRKEPLLIKGLFLYIVGMKYDFKDFIKIVYWIIPVVILVGIDTLVLNNFLGDLDFLIIILFGIGVL